MFRFAFSEGCHWDVIFTARALLIAFADGHAGRGRWSGNQITLSIAHAYLYLFFTVDTVLGRGNEIHGLRNALEPHGKRGGWD